MALGLTGGLALLLAPSQFGGWSLTLASGIFRGVPDFLFHLEPDQPFYLAYFLAGWWLHRDRDALPEVARAWMPYLLAGLAAHSASIALHTIYAGGSGLIRLGGYALYGVGSTYTALGFLAFFQRYLNRPSRVGRYLSDTALWVYLVHLPLMRPFLAAVTPMGLPWWLEGALVVAMTTAAALLLFEVIIRPTPLMTVFGPGGTPRRQSPAMATVGVEG
jgi:glucan biosynthesis protein C